MMGQDMYWLCTFWIKPPDFDAFMRGPFVSAVSIVSTEAGISCTSESVIAQSSTTNGTKPTPIPGVPRTPAQNAHRQIVGSGSEFPYGRASADPCR